VSSNGVQGSLAIESDRGPHFLPLNYQIAWNLTLNIQRQRHLLEHQPAQLGEHRGRRVGLKVLLLAHGELPHQLRRNSSSVFDPAHDSIKVMTLHVSKGLEFPVVALVGAGRMPAEGEDEREEARLFYVGATRATQRLVIGASGSGKFAARLQARGKA
jgi:ATP-dependent exoDNAse (exonuclease V) beta subunit